MLHLFAALFVKAAVLSVFAVAAGVLLLVYLNFRLEKKNQEEYRGYGRDTVHFLASALVDDTLSKNPQVRKRHQLKRFLRTHARARGLN